MQRMEVKKLLFCINMLKNVIVGDVSEPDLLLDGEGVQKVSPEDEGILRGVDGVDPPRRDEEGGACVQRDHAALLHLEEKSLSFKNSSKVAFSFSLNRPEFDSKSF